MIIILANNNNNEEELEVVVNNELITSYILSRVLSNYIMSSSSPHTNSKR